MHGAFSISVYRTITLFWNIKFNALRAIHTTKKLYYCCCLICKSNKLPRRR